jgi:hypothetical protein
MSKLTRRLLVFGGSIVALPIVGFAAARVLCAIETRSRSARATIALVAELFPDSAATRPLSEAYLAQVSSTPLMALQRLEQDDRIRASAETGCSASAQSAFEQACREDFAAGRVHCVDGWILAQTELDAAAVHTLI